MEYYLNGSIETEKAMSRACRIAVGRVIENEGLEGIRIAGDGKSVELDDTYSRDDGQEFLNAVAKAMSENGSEPASGRVSAYGDEDFGYVYRPDKKAFEYFTAEGYAIMNMAHRDLIRTLSARQEIAKDVVDERTRAKAEQCLIDNGIEADEAPTVLNAVSSILIGLDLYPGESV